VISGVVEVLEQAIGETFQLQKEPPCLLLRRWPDV
jgi:hypothetical protein